MFEIPVPLFSIIIPTCNRSELLGQCLDKLEASIQILEPGLCEVIVSNDSKNHYDYDLIQTSHNEVKWINGPSKGPAANRNNGAKYAKGKWLIFIDDDCLPNEDLLQEYYKAIQHYKGIEVFEGFIGVDREKRSFIEESPINENGGFLWSCNFMISKGLFETLNGFDVNFPYAAMEDVDLRYRIQQIGKQIKFISTARVIHPWRIEKKILFKTKMRFQSTIYFLGKHPEMHKKLNSVYFLKTAFNKIKDVFKSSFEFEFRGFGKHILIILMYMRFAILLSFSKKFF